MCQSSIVYECPECKKTYKLYNTATQHFKTSCGLSVSYACKECNFIGRSMKAIKCHVLRLHISKMKYLKCDYCKKEFKMKVDLKNHIEHIHCSSNTSDIRRSKKEKSKKYQCAHCGRKLTSKHYLIQHISKFHITDSTLNMETEFFAECSKCDKKFIGQGAKHKMKVHLEVCDENEYLECKLCSHATKQKDDFTMHMKTVHGMLSIEKTEKAVLDVDQTISQDVEERQVKGEFFIYLNLQLKYKKMIFFCVV